MYEANVARLAEIGAYTVTIDDDGTVTVDISPLVTAAAVAVAHLIEYLAAAKQMGRGELIMTIREVWDEM